MSSENREVHQLQLPILHMKKIEQTEILQEQMGSDQLQGRIYQGTEFIRAPNIAFGRQTKGVIDVSDFLYLNIFAGFCCCSPFGLMGTIFSVLCKNAKSKGNRADAECYSILAKILFAFSVIGGIVASILTFMILYDIIQ